MRRPLGGWFAALLCLAGCATAPPPPPPPPPTAPPQPAPTAAVPAPLPCSGIGVETSRLGQPIAPPPGTGIRHLDELVSEGKVEWTSDIPGKPVDWVVRTDAMHAHAIWALARVEGGWCVLG